jgi:integrase
VKTPPIATKPRTTITVEQFDRLLHVVDDEAMRLLLETDIETGLRWGELTELRPRDVDLNAGIVTVGRVVVRTDSAAGAIRPRFAVKPYPRISNGAGCPSALTSSLGCGNTSSCTIWALTT